MVNHKFQASISDRVEQIHFTDRIFSFERAKAEIRDAGVVGGLGRKADEGPLY